MQLLPTLAAANYPLYYYDYSTCASAALFLLNRKSIGNGQPEPITRKIVERRLFGLTQHPTAGRTSGGEANKNNKIKYNNMNMN